MEFGEFEGKLGEAIILAWYYGARNSDTVTIDDRKIIKISGESHIDIFIDLETLCCEIVGGTL